MRRVLPLSCTWKQVAESIGSLQVDATLAAGVDIVVWRDNQHNRKRPMRAAMREYAPMQKSLAG
jgi:hypothetical protein